jgi:hypothetical protein
MKKATTNSERDNIKTPMSTEFTSPNQKPLPKKGSHKKLKILLSTLAIVLLLPLLIAGWYGFVPGLSNLMGARNPRDLGVVWTEADYISFIEKTGASFMDYENAPARTDDPAKKEILSDPNSATDLLFTQEELSAAINSVKWSWMPISNAQVRISEGTVEVSGNLELDNIEDFVRFIGGVGYNESDVAEAAKWGRRFVNGAPIYIKTSAEVTNDVASLALQEVTVGRYKAPQEIASNVIYNGTNNSVNNAANFEAKAANFTEEGLVFTGTYPRTVYVLYD